MKARTNGEPIDVESQDNEAEQDEIHDVGTTLGPKAAVDLLDRVRAIPETCQELNKVNAHLAEMFAAHYGANAILQKHEVPTVYRRFFVQVSVLLGNDDEICLMTRSDRCRGVCPPDDDPTCTRRPRPLQQQSHLP
jgi:hypothetical protein